LAASRSVSACAVSGGCAKIAKLSGILGQWTNPSHRITKEGKSEKKATDWFFIACHGGPGIYRMHTE
jgi:hypothetical protein